MICSSNTTLSARVGVVGPRRIGPRDLAGDLAGDLVGDAKAADRPGDLVGDAKAADLPGDLVGEAKAADLPGDLAGEARRVPPNRGAAADDATITCDERVVVGPC